MYPTQPNYRRWEILTHFHVLTATGRPYNMQFVEFLYAVRKTAMSPTRCWEITILQEQSCYQLILLTSDSARPIWVCTQSTNMLHSYASIQAVIIKCSQSKFRSIIHFDGFYPVLTMICSQINDLSNKLCKSMVPYGSKTHIGPSH